MRKLFCIIVLTAVCLTGCHRTGKTYLPTISGKAGEVIVVIDKEYWDGELGASVRQLLARECPYLAQREPLYTLVNVPPTGFSDIFRIHRNIVFFDINPQVAAPGVYLLGDKWATPQCLIRISAPDQETAVGLVKTKGETIEMAIEQAERDRVIANTLRYEARNIYPNVASLMGGSPHFPNGYSLRKASDDFVWVDDEKQYTRQGIFVYRYPATGDPDEFSWDNIIAHRNAILKEKVPGMFEGTYMTTSDATIPSLKYLRYKGRDFVEARGFWEVHNDFMGGPFVSHSFYSPDGQYVIVTEAFVYAPKYDKRQYLRQVESILYSFEWQKGKEE